MQSDRPHQEKATLMFQTAEGAPWSLHLSPECLVFIGRYRRLEGFAVDPAMLFEGLRRVR